MSKPLNHTLPIQSFDGISLEQLNSKDAMMESLDNKYIVHETLSINNNY